jgi:diguanylate cyclase (GGDEF)-like protein/PAS domain S-box-containing protein
MELFKKIVESLSDGVYFVDEDRRITFWNKAAEQISGYPAAEVVGSHCYHNILAHVDDRGNNLCQRGCPLSKTLRDGRFRQEEIYLHHKDGHRVPVSTRVTPIRNEEGRIVGAVEVFIDNSPKAAIEARLRELETLALLDPVTRLANRRYVERELERFIREMVRRRLGVGVLFLGVDAFERIRLEHGDEAGHRILRVIAETFVRNARPFDLFGYWEEGLFVGLVRNVHSNALFNIAENLRILVEKSFFMEGDVLVHSTLSVGGTLLHPEETGENVLARARQLMEESRQAGANRVTIDLKILPVD